MARLGLFLVQDTYSYIRASHYWHFHPYSRKKKMFESKNQQLEFGKVVLRWAHLRTCAKDKENYFTLFPFYKFADNTTEQERIVKESECITKCRAKLNK